MCDASKQNSHFKIFLILIFGYLSMKIGKETLGSCIGSALSTTFTRVLSTNVVPKVCKWNVLSILAA